MTHKILIATTLATLLFSGCAQSAPDLDDNSNLTVPDTISGDTVNIDESTYGNESNSNINANGTGYNTSADGFQSIYFGFDGYTISTSMQNNMQTNTQIANTATATIKIEGNCDEFGTDEYNYALGLKRAKTVKDSLVAQGIAESKIVLVSFGESTPVCQAPSDSCYDRNRRVDLRLVR